MENVVILATIALFLISVILCILPKFLIKKSAAKRIYPLVTMFTAGIQLATILLELMPHMFETHGHDLAEHGDGCNHGTHMHSHAFHEHEAHDHNDNGHNHKAEHHHHHNNMLPLTLVGCTFIALLAVDILFLHGDHCDSKGHHSHKTDTEYSHMHSHTDEDHHEHAHGHMHSHTPGHTHAHAHAHSHDSLGTCNTAAISQTSSKVKALIVLLAISVHSFFEGLSINPHTTTSTFAVGMLLHKILESFTIGVSIYQSPFSEPIRICLVLFYSALTPFGIILATILTKVNGALAIWFTALTLGSMLFIVFIEMIAHSFNDPKTNAVNLCMLVVGYAVGSVAIINTPHSH